MYAVPGNAAGHPLNGYSGSMLVMNNDNINLIVKVLFLSNSYTYIMSQNSKDGNQVYSAWQLIHGA